MFMANGSVECHGANLYAVFVAQYVDNETMQNLRRPGVLVQGGYMVIPDKLEPFARYEYIDYDGFSNLEATSSILDDAINILTCGAGSLPAQCLIEIEGYRLAGRAISPGARCHRCPYAIFDYIYISANPSTSGKSS